MDRQVMLDLFDKARELAVAGKFGDLCAEVGKFIEAVATNECTEHTGNKPPNTKEAIDRLTAARLLSPVLACKMHLVRVLRNAQIHMLTDEISQAAHTYQPTKADARLAVETLDEFLQWLYNERVTAEWSLILERFHSHEAALSTSEHDSFVLVSPAYHTLRQALDLKISSLGLKPVHDLTSGIEVLLTKGIDVRSDAWKRLATLRIYDAHGTPEQYDAFLESGPEFAKEIFPGLRVVLSKLNPMRSSTAAEADFPSVPADILGVLSA